MDKPEFLYHGSAHRGLSELQPQSRLHRADEGELLYATQDLATAAIFLVGGVHYGCGRFGETQYAWIISDRDEFIRNDKGGHIYILPSDSFEISQGRGLGNYEWASKVPVKPIKTIEYDSVVDTIIGNGVQVYFIDEDTYRKIEASDDHGRSIYNSMESENQHRGVNVKKL